MLRYPGILFFLAVGGYKSNPKELNVFTATLSQCCSPLERVMTEVDPSLIALETLDRTSPELWPEPIPGVSVYAHLHSSVQNKSQQPWNRPLDKEDIQLLNYYGTLSQKELIAEVKKLYDIAYNLGVEEAKEMTRGKYLHILQKKKNH